MINREDVSRYYQFPLYCDEYGCYLWTANNKFAFETFCEEYESNKKIVDILNGTSDKVLPNISIDKTGECIACCGHTLLFIRGFGWLTGMGLSAEKIKEIQRKMLEFAAEKLSGGNYKDFTKKDENENNKNIGER